MYIGGYKPRKVKGMPLPPIRNKNEAERGGGIKGEKADDCLIQSLRNVIQLTEEDATDLEILEMTKGSLLRQRVELEIAWKDLGEVMINEAKKMLKKIIKIGENLRSNLKK